MGRPLDGDTNGVAIVDVGAYEFIHPLADSDGDEMLDAGEVIAGTNPADPASVLRLGIRLESEPARALLSWPSVLGRTYALEFTPVLPSPGPWQVLNDDLQGTGDQLGAFDPVPGGTNRYYRVRVWVP